MEIQYEKIINTKLFEITLLDTFLSKKSPMKKSNSFLFFDSHDEKLATLCLSQHDFLDSKWFHSIKAVNMHKKNNDEQMK